MKGFISSSHLFVIVEKREGWDDDKPDNILINHMILLLKRYIYLKKKDQNGLNFNGFTVFFKMIEIIEWRIAQERDKLYFHCGKWDLI